MDTVFSTVVQLTIATKVMAFKFEGFRNTLPSSTDLKATILDLQEKQDFTVTDINDAAFIDSMTSTHFVTSKPDVMIKPRNTLVNKLSEFDTPRQSFLRTKETDPLNTATAKAIEKSQVSSPSVHQVPVPVAVAAVHMPVPVYARVPVMLPMRTYFEPVIHDHPPLYKIKEMIKEDEKKWKIKEKDCEISVEISYDDDTSSDQSDDTSIDSSSSMSDYNDIDLDYYDSLTKLTNGGDK